MNLNGQTIIEALQVIKQVCEDNIQDDCKFCPFEVCGVCGVTDLHPYNWSVSKYKKFQALN